MKSSEKAIQEFRTIVWDFYKKSGRHDLPWRKTEDPYKILVSEVMLQQTQVDRVRPYYAVFLKQFPTVEELAAASLADVLRTWQGLGYNRRAKMLHEAAKEVVQNYGGTFPKSVEELQGLRGIGPYTARAVAAFAYNQDVVFIETNLRTVITYHFLMKKESISDKEILEILSRSYEAGTAREWYGALMDYGSALKRAGIRVNAKKKGYKKQAKFEGSFRQARGAILKALASGPRKGDFLVELLGIDRREQLRGQLASLTKEGLIELKNGKFQLPQ